MLSYSELADVRVKQLDKPLRKWCAPSVLFFVFYGMRIKSVSGIFESNLFVCRVFSISRRDYTGEPTVGNDSNDQIDDIPGQIPRHLTSTLPVDARHQHRGEL